MSPILVGVLTALLCGHSHAHLARRPAHPNITGVWLDANTDLWTFHPDGRFTKTFERRRLPSLHVARASKSGGPLAYTQTGIYEGHYHWDTVGHLRTRADKYKAGPHGTYPGSEPMPMPRVEAVVSFTGTGMTMRIPPGGERLRLKRVGQVKS